MPRFVDKTGMRFGSLVAMSYQSVNGRFRWLCRCDCGNRTIVAGGNLHLNDDGGTRSCGCSKKGNPTHGQSRTAIYRIWKKMRRRCGNPKDSGFRYYGARGITVCKRWQVFENFLADMGERPSPRHSIDRINNNLGYKPSNCRWATVNEQRRNTRITIRIKYKGKTLAIADWAELLGINYRTLVRRYHLNMPVDRMMQPGRLHKSR